jgi:hypothetical protein
MKKGRASSGGCWSLANAPRQPLGLHVFVPDFETKAANHLDNLDHNRIRLIQAVLGAA